MLPLVDVCVRECVSLCSGGRQEEKTRGQKNGVGLVGEDEARLGGWEGGTLPVRTQMFVPLTNESRKLTIYWDLHFLSIFTSASRLPFSASRGMILRATNSPSLLSKALYTFPNAPFPNGCIMS